MTVTAPAEDRRAAPTPPVSLRSGPGAGGPRPDDGRPAARSDAGDALLHAFEARCRVATTVRAAVLLEPDGTGDALRLRGAWPPGVPTPAPLVQASVAARRGSRPVRRPLDALRPEGGQVFAGQVRRGRQLLGLVAVLLDGPPDELERDLGRWLALVDAPDAPGAPAGTRVGAAPSSGPSSGPASAPSSGPPSGPASQPSSGPSSQPPTRSPPTGRPGPPAPALSEQPPVQARPPAGADPRPLPAREEAAAGGVAGAGARILECQAALFDAADLDEGLQALLAVLAGQYGCDRVAFGWSERAGARVVSLSHSAAGTITRESGGPLATAMDEAIDQQSCLTWPGIPGRDAPIVVAQAQLARLVQAEAVCSVPLAWHGEPVGALTLERRARFDDATLLELGRVAAFLAPLLAIEREATRPLQALRRRAWARLFGPRRRAGVVLVALAVAAAAALLLPVPDRVSAPARVEGAVQRTLTAPVDGWLLRVHVRPGDAVKTDQVLVELDDRDLGLERLRWATEAEQADRQATEAIAREDRAQFAGHAARAAQARAQLALVDAQLARQRVRAPFDGLVLAGDLTQSLGAPVRAGDTLVSVAPAGRHRVIVEVDERDVARIALGTAGELSLLAHAGRRVPIEVVRISPAAVARDGRTVFEVEAHPRAEAELRPGYQGVAKLDADARTLARSLFGRPWRAVAQRLWAWGW